MYIIINWNVSNFTYPKKNNKKLGQNEIWHFIGLKNLIIYIYKKNLLHHIRSINHIHTVINNYHLYLEHTIK